MSMTPGRFKTALVCKSRVSYGECEGLYSMVNNFVQNLIYRCYYYYYYYRYYYYYHYHYILLRNYFLLLNFDVLTMHRNNDLQIGC